MPLGPKARLWMPVISTSVAVTALIFQTCVLYPWHEELNEEMKTLKREQSELLKEYHESKLKRLDELEKRMDGMIVNNGSGSGSVSRRS